MTLIPDSEFGRQVRARLRDEQTIWLTTVGADGTPQPNPVWFLWDGESDDVLIYNANKAARLRHIADRPQVSLNFNTGPGGEDVVVFTGTAEVDSAAPPVDRNAPYLAKYTAGIQGLGSTAEQMAANYATVLRIRLAKVRGF